MDLSVAKGSPAASVAVTASSTSSLCVPAATPGNPRWDNCPMSLLPHQIELLSPARDADIGIEAVNHRADAVDIGGPALGARARGGMLLRPSRAPPPSLPLAVATSDLAIR